MAEGRTIIDTDEPGLIPPEKRPSLIVLAGRDFGRQYFLAQGETTIGRDDNCTIPLNDGRVSRRHAKIVGDPLAPAGPQFKVIDLGSTNGTFLNDQKINEAELDDGDKIRIGYTVFKYAVRDVVEIEYEDRIYRMATTDALTGLLSREYFMQQYTDTFHRSERYGRPFSIMMIDIDDFKAVNDTHGHPAGDVVLGVIGKLILKVIRHEDRAARYGGEEFIILLPETSPRDALYPAERLCESVEARKFKTGDNPFSVTLSIGIAGYPDHATAIDELVEKADQALYRAKKSGKNMVKMGEPDTKP